MLTVRFHKSILQKLRWFADIQYCIHSTVGFTWTSLDVADITLGSFVGESGY